MSSSADYPKYASESTNSATQWSSYQDAEASDYNASSQYTSDSAQLKKNGATMSSLVHQSFGEGGTTYLIMVLLQTGMGMMNDQVNLVASQMNQVSALSSLSTGLQGDLNTLLSSSTGASTTIGSGNFSTSSDFYLQVDNLYSAVSNSTTLDPTTISTVEAQINTLKSAWGSSWPSSSVMYNGQLTSSQRTSAWNNEVVSANKTFNSSIWVDQDLSTGTGAINSKLSTVESATQEISQSLSGYSSTLNTLMTNYTNNYSDLEGCLSSSTSSMTSLNSTIVNNSAASL